MVHKAQELLSAGEKAIAIFTKGDLFHHDLMGDGSTGNWKAGEKSLEDIDKVIIYHRDKLTGRNTIYLGGYAGWENSQDEGRKTIHFS